MPFNSANLDAGILQKLVVIAQEFYNVMSQTANQKNLPEEIIENTSIKSPKKAGKGYSIDVVIDTSEDAAPMAGAYEWGSGEHGDRGSTYEIAPREKAVLAFPWTPEQIPWRSHKFAGMGRDGKFLFYWVDHPGVKARPYIKPSIMAIKDKARQILGKEFKAQILSQTPRVTIIDATK